MLRALVVFFALLAGGCAFISSPYPFQQQGETSGFIRTAVDDALDPGTLPTFCQEATFDYARRVSGVEINRREGDVTVRHRGAAACKREVMRRPGGGVEGVSGWQYVTPQ